MLLASLEGSSTEHCITRPLRRLLGILAGNDCSGTESHGSCMALVRKLKEDRGGKVNRERIQLTGGAKAGLGGTLTLGSQRGDGEATGYP